MKKYILVILFMIVTLQANEKVTLQLSWKHQFQFAGYYVAKELGYYKAAGIDVDIKEFDFGVDLTQSVLDGSSDFAVGRSSIIIDKSEGKDIIALAAIYQKSPLMLLVRKDSGIEKLENFKNKKIMITTDAKSTAAIMAMLQSHGITQKDIILQTHSFNLDDLITGKTDAMASYVSNEPIKLESKNIEYKIFHPKDYGFNFYNDILFTSSKFLKENPKLVKGFYEATIKGWQYAFNNIGKTSQIIYNKYNTQNKSIVDLVAEAEALRKLVYHGKTNEIGYLDKDVMNSILHTYKVLGLVSQDIDIEELIYEGNKHDYIELEFEYDEAFLFVLIFILLFIIILSSIIFFIVKAKLLHTNGELEEEILNATNKIAEQNKIILTQSRVAAAGEMIGNIAHQWRQPLNVISLQSSNIIASVELEEDISNDVLIESMNSINDKCQYLSQTIDDFRSFLNQSNDELNEILLVELINKMEHLVSDSLNNNNIKLIKNIENITLMTNESMICQPYIIHRTIYSKQL